MDPTESPDTAVDSYSWIAMIVNVYIHGADSAACTVNYVITHYIKVNNPDYRLLVCVMIQTKIAEALLSANLIGSFQRSVLCSWSTNLYIAIL